MKILWDRERREIRYGDDPAVAAYAKHISEVQAKEIDDFFRRHAPGAYGNGFWHVSDPTAKISVRVTE